jgi:hypothetical protein
MQVSTPFSDAKTSISQGMEFMDILNLDALDLQDPTKHRRFRDIVGFLGQFDDAKARARRVAAGTAPADRLDKLWAFVNIRKQILDIDNELTDLSSKMEKEEDREQKGELRGSIQKLEVEKDSLVKEAEIFEK